MTDSWFCAFCQRSLFRWNWLSRLLYRLWPRNEHHQCLHRKCVEKYCRGKEHAAKFWRMKHDDLQRAAQAKEGEGR